MLLTIDLGNTSIKLGVFEKERQICFGTFPSKQEDFGAIIKNFLYRNNLKEEHLDDVIISSVVPSSNNHIKQDVTNIIGKEPIFIRPCDDYGIKLDVPHPEEVGCDIVAMCAYAYYKFKEELIIVSIGTASVICHVTKNGEFRHCIIFPGYGKIAQTLWSNTAKLPEFTIARTKSFLPTNTVDAMNTGIYQGYIGEVRSLLAGMKGELMANPKIVGCGGFGKNVVDDIPEIEYYEPDLVTLGLNYIYYRYIKNETNIG